MKKLVALAAVLAFIGSCKKKTDDKQEKIPGEFYISFKTVDSAYTYKAGNKFNYYCGDLGGYNPNHFFRPSTIITTSEVYPDPAIFHIGFQFYYSETCDRCWPDLVKYGNELFPTGAKFICNTNSTQTQLSNLGCYDKTGVLIFFTDAAGKFLHSTAEVQPAGNYFNIDSVVDYHYESPDYSLHSFDKIIIGRFSTRVFDPQNKTYYKDLTEGKFRMPVWRNKL